MNLISILVILSGVFLSLLFYGLRILAGVCSPWNATAEERIEADRFQSSLCGHCMNLSHVTSVSAISCEQFTEVYARTGRPLIVRDAIPSSILKDLSLAEVLAYFNSLYLKSAASETVHKYFTEFRSVVDGITEIREAGDIFGPAQKDNLTSLPWYFNWRVFSEEFLERKESLVPTPYCFSPWAYPGDDHVEFFFAHPKEKSISSFVRHVDTTEASGTWHAQLAGLKMWELWPPIECEGVCKPINVTVKVCLSMSPINNPVK
jgi:hypothetical protein